MIASRIGGLREAMTARGLDVAAYSWMGDETDSAELAQVGLS